MNEQTLREIIERLRKNAIPMPTNEEIDEVYRKYLEAKV